MGIILHLPTARTLGHSHWSGRVPGADPQPMDPQRPAPSGDRVVPLRRSGGTWGADGAEPAGTTDDGAGATAVPPLTPQMRMLRWLGLVLLAAGAVGIFLPLLPTTIFWILAALCFGKSDPRLQAWIFGHHRFGAAVEAFVQRGLLSRKAKLAASGGILSSFVLSWFLLEDGTTRLILGASLAAVILYVLTRPER